MAKIEGHCDGGMGNRNGDDVLLVVEQVIFMGFRNAQNG